MRVPEYDVQVVKKYGNGMQSEARTVHVNEFKDPVISKRKMRLVKERLDSEKTCSPEVRARAEALFNAKTLGTFAEIADPKILKRKYSSCDKRAIVRILKEVYQDDEGFLCYTYETSEKICTVLARNIIEMNITDFKWFLKRYLAIRDTPFVIPESLKLMFEKSKVVHRRTANLQGTLFITRKCSEEISGTVKEVIKC